MTLIEKLTMQLTEEQREVFFDLIEEFPDVPPITLFRRVLRQSENVE
jgi:hypothetical protein